MVSAYSSLPTTDPTSGGGVYLPIEEAEALGLPVYGQAANASGSIGFGAANFYDFSPTNRAVANEADFIGIAEHEIAHALGRIGSLGTYGYWTVLDLFRFTSPGSLATNVSQSAYFSINDGTTALKYFDNTNTDPADWTTSGPNAGDEDNIEPRWQRWLRWLRIRRISGISATIKSVDPLGIAERVERFERRRWQQRYARDGRRDDIKPDRRMSGGLDTHFLKNAFGWLFAEGYGLPDPAEQANLLSAFWSHEAWCLRGSADEDDDDFKSRGQLGYSIAWALAYLALSSPAAKANGIWE
jgi:hypothetical protein